MPAATRVQVNVADTPLVAANSGRGAPRRKVVVKNGHSASIFLQSSGVGAATLAGGYDLAAGATSPEITLDRGESLSAISLAQTAVGAVSVFVTDDAGDR